MVAAIDDGKVDLAHSSTPYLISAVLKGSNAVGIAGEIGNPVYTLIVRPEIASYADLRGKVIALSVAADTISITTRKLLAKHGVKDGEFKVRQLVGTPVRFACLKSGECAGVPLGQPADIEAVKDGLPPARRHHRGGRQFPVPAHRRASQMGGRQSGQGGVVRARGGGRVPLHPRSGQPRRDDQADGGADRLLGGDRARGDGALFRARPRRDAAPGRDRSQGLGAGDRVHGRGGRIDGAAAAGRAVRRPAIPEGGGLQ